MQDACEKEKSEEISGDKCSSDQQPHPPSTSIGGPVTRVVSSAALGDTGQGQNLQQRQPTPTVRVRAADSGATASTTTAAPQLPAASAITTALPASAPVTTSAALTTPASQDGGSRPQRESGQGRVQRPSTQQTGSRPRSTSAYRGVCWNRKNKRWQASINVGGKYLYLGSFKCDVEAARAFDRVALEVRGPRAKLNFPQEAAALGGLPAEGVNKRSGSTDVGAATLGSFSQAQPHSAGAGQEFTVCMSSTGLAVVGPGGSLEDHRARRNPKPGAQRDYMAKGPVQKRSSSRADAAAASRLASAALAVDASAPDLAPAVDVAPAAGLGLRPPPLRGAAASNRGMALDGLPMIRVPGDAVALDRLSSLRKQSTVTSGSFSSAHIPGLKAREVSAGDPVGRRLVIQKLNLLHHKDPASLVSSRMDAVEGGAGDHALGGVDGTKATLTDVDVFNRPPNDGSQGAPIVAIVFKLATGAKPFFTAVLEGGRKHVLPNLASRDEARAAAERLAQLAVLRASNSLKSSSDGDAGDTAHSVRRELEPEVPLQDVMNRTPVTCAEAAGAEVLDSRRLSMPLSAAATTYEDVVRSFRG